MLIKIAALYFLNWFKKLFLKAMAVCFKTCLLIDDNYIDNFVTRKILEGSDFVESIIVVRSATEAISSLTDGTIQPDVIFLDVRMPMMSGFEFLEEYDKIAIDKEAIKIYMLSSSLDPVDLKKSTDNKYITQFIHKPLTQKALEELCP
jgi:CheY-like chemotaxis protein